jgi:predicted nuclease of predicted toxin-antitoxin system
MARYFADECVSTRVVELLKARGFDVVHAGDICPGDTDDRALALAFDGGRVVITDDFGFGELAVRHGQPAVGVIILSLYELPSGRREEYAAERISDVDDRIDGRLAVIEPGRVLLRPLPRSGES